MERKSRHVLGYFLQWYLDWLKLTWENLEKPVLFIYLSDDPSQMLADFMA